MSRESKQLRYTLAPDGRTPVPEEDLYTWAEWMETADRHVKNTELEVKANGRKMGLARVSTVFLGLDHAWTDTDEPILFETMIFGPEPYDQMMWRYHTWEAAEQGHDTIVAVMTAGGNPENITLPTGEKK